MHMEKESLLQVSKGQIKLTFTEGLSVRHCYNYLICINSFDLHNNPIRYEITCIL